jgi:hypothetical protein
MPLIEKSKVVCANLAQTTLSSSSLSRIFLICFETAGISQNLNASFSMYKAMHKADYKKD